ncbi:MAG TPA: rod shape-determining protein MreD [Methylomirabilota bacterium]|nr:rod shape-determining protein MreD [Methylomirabilota bacterium]
MIFLLGIILTIFAFLEGSITTLPLVLLFLLCFASIKKDAIVFPVAFVIGLLLDLLLVHPIGVSSFFFVIFLFFVLLYQRKYEINSYPFVAVASFLGAMVFLLVFGYDNVFLLSVVSAVFAVIFFGGLHVLLVKKS